MTDEERRPDAPGGGRPVGLGRVVEDHRPASTTADDSVAAGEAPAGEADGDADERVAEASEDSFPASDPPGFMSDQATPGTRNGERRREP